MRERLYIGILPIHEENVIIKGKRKKGVKTRIEKRIEVANQKFPDFDFYPGVRIYRARRIK